MREQRFIHAVKVTNRKLGKGKIGNRNWENRNLKMVTNFLFLYFFFHCFYVGFGISDEDLISGNDNWSFEECVFF
jgi:hypothetical protein